MFYKILKYALPILLFLNSCSTDYEKAVDITGNWYFFMDTFEYNEVYVTDSSFLYYSEISGIYGPLKYNIINDSIFFYSKRFGKYNIEDYSPNLTIVNSDKFILQYKNQINIFHRMKKDIYPIDSILNKIDHYKFLNEFYKRKKVSMLQKGFYKDTSAISDTLVIEEEEIGPSN